MGTLKPLRLEGVVITKTECENLDKIAKEKLIGMRIVDAQYSYFAECILVQLENGKWVALSNSETGNL